MLGPSKYIHSWVSKGQNLSQDDNAQIEVH